MSETDTDRTSTQRTWADVRDSVTTWGDLNDGRTWADVLNGTKPDRDSAAPTEEAS